MAPRSSRGSRRSIRSINKHSRAESGEGGDSNPFNLKADSLKIRHRRSVFASSKHHSALVKGTSNAGDDV